ncbi:MAG TPA: AI-2E family transporter [Thermodesulfobacteriota bacterium]|nr:AI-2E family transporter [Thermodesulfobacteriota bacterium]
MNGRNSNTITNERSAFVKRVLIAVGVTVLIVLLLLLFGYVVHVVLLVFAGVLLAIFLRGLSDLVRKFIPISEGWSLAIVGVILVAFIVVGMWFLAPRVAGQLDQLTQNLSQSLRKFEDYASQYGWGRQIIAQMPKPDKLISGIGETNVFSKATGVVSATLGIITDIVVILFVGTYVAVDPRLYINGIVRLTPITKRRRAHEVLDVLGHTLRWWLIGRVISMIVVGILSTLGLWLLGVPLALTLGLVAALLDFVPYVGPIIAVIPAALVGLSQSPTTALYVLLLYLVIQSIEGYFLEPLVQQRMVSLPPAFTITAQVLFGVLIGTIGVVFATPLAVALMALVMMLYVEDTLGDSVKMVSDHTNDKESTVQRKARREG